MQPTNPTMNEILLLSMITNGATFHVNHIENTTIQENPQHTLCYNPALYALSRLTVQNHHNDLFDIAGTDYQVTLHMTDGATIPLATSSDIVTEDRNLSPEAYTTPSQHFTHLSVITEETDLANPEQDLEQMIRISYPVTHIKSFTINLI